MHKSLFLIILVLILIIGGYYFFSRNTTEQSSFNEAAVIQEFEEVSDVQNDPNKLIEEQFKQLLSLEEINSVIGDTVTLSIEFTDFFPLAAASVPEQLEDKDSWFGLKFIDSQGNNDIDFSVTDFSSSTPIPLDKQFEKLQKSLGVGPLDIDLGDAAFGSEANEDSVGSILFFGKGDKIVLFITGIYNDQPLTDLEGLITLARLVEERL